MPDQPLQSDQPAPASRRTSLAELARLFLRLGFTAFGGPAAHIAMMEDEVVRKRAWLTHEQFLDMLGATNLIPGPNSTEMAIHIGHKRAGFPGLLVAGACFIVPAAVMVTIIAWAYVQYGSLPRAQGLLYGIKPVIIAIVVQALWRLGRTAIKNWPLAVITGAACAASALGVNELAVLAACGVLMGSMGRIDPRRPAKEAAPAAAEPGKPQPPTQAFIPLARISSPLAAAGATAVPFGLWPMFLIFLKIGSVLFGSGYVLLAFLRSDFVEHRHWLTEPQLLDAVAVGQFTPGPVFTTATFVGYLLGGTTGAVVATVGIFLPAFFFVAISGPLLPMVRKSATAAGFLDGVNTASLALMAVVTVQLGRSALVDVPTVVMSLVAAAIVFSFKLNSAWLVLGGAIAGLVVTLLR